MALKGSRIENFDKLGTLLTLRGFDISVSLTTFQKRNIHWPQQPPTEKVLRFNMIFEDSTPHFFFSKHKNKT